MAAMLAEATKPRPKKKTTSARKLGFAPAEALRTLRGLAPDAVVWPALSPSDYARMGRVLRETNTDQEETVELVGRWLAAGGLAWMHSTPGLKYLLAYWGDVVGRARDWEQRGCEDLGGGPPTPKEDTVLW